MSVQLPFTFVNNTPADADEVNANFSTIVNAFNSHLQETNPHGVTPQQIGAETPEGAQQKATDALNAAKDYTDQQVATRAEITHSHEADDLPKASTTAQGIVQLTNARTSSSETLALTARAMDEHRRSGDHDTRYYTKYQLEPIIHHVLLDHWTVLDNVTIYNLRGVTHAVDIWIAVGDGGTILTSPDGISWTSRTSGTSNALNSVAYANGLRVAVGVGGTILTSTNGTSWTSRTSGTTLSLNSVAYANGLWVAVGNGGVIRTSSDGISWTGRSSGTSENLNSVSYHNGLWVAVGDNGRNLTSTNGTSWVARASSAKTLNSVAYVNDLWIAVGDGGTILTSPDGISWTKRPSGTSEDLNSVAYFDGFGVAVGGGGTILTSMNGLSWTKRSSGTSEALNSVSYTAYDSWVAVGDKGTISIARVEF